MYQTLTELIRVKVLHVYFSHPSVFQSQCAGTSLFTTSDIPLNNHSNLNSDKPSSQQILATDATPPTTVPPSTALTSSPSTIHSTPQETVGSWQCSTIQLVLAECCTTSHYLNVINAYYFSCITTCRY